MENSCPAYPGIKKVGFMPANIVSDRLRALAALGARPSMPDEGVSADEITWVSTTDSPIMSRDDSASAAAFIPTTLIQFSVKYIQFPLYSAWVVVDAMGEAWLVAPPPPKCGELKVRRTTSAPGADPVAFSCEVSLPAPPLRVRI